MSAIYKQFASVYDLMGADRHSARMCDYTLRLLGRFDIKGRTGLDICCGTGTALRFFADKGYEMVGVDQSQSMLTEAKRKLGKRAKVKKATLPKFYIADLNNSRRQFKADFAISFYDSLNYLLSVKDLQAAFLHIARHLKPGGWFIFDMNAPHALETIWGNSVWGGAQPRLAWIFRHTYDEANILATCRTTFFVNKGKSWKRFDETHIERGYSLIHLRKVLRSAGFEVKATYKCFTFANANKQTNRFCIVARKRRR